MTKECLLQEQLHSSFKVAKQEHVTRGTEPGISVQGSLSQVKGCRRHTQATVEQEIVAPTQNTLRKI
jgi:hypothetical protein